MEGSVNQRIKEIIEYYSLTQKKFAESIDSAQSTISSLFKRGSIPSAQLVEKIANAFPRINRDWLLTGEGDMLKPDNDIKEEDKEYSPCEDVTYVPLVPVASKGGNIDEYTSSIKLSDCEKILSPTPNAEIAITIRGDSMFPKYPNGTIAFIKEIDADLFIEWGRVYVLNTVNGSVTKVLTPSKKKGYIRCESLNPDKKFAPFDVPMKSIKGIYKILLSINPE